MFDIVALGEILIDFTPHGESENGNILFERNPGGAPANVLAAAAKLGLETAFTGKVGNDRFGLYLADLLKAMNINTDGLVFSNAVNTTLAFVHLYSSGDRSFSFYRNPGADVMLKEDEVKENLISKAKIFHCGSVSMTHESARSATFKALNLAKKHNAVISFDPNLRPALWDNLDSAKEIIMKGIAYADILKVSEEELFFLSGITNLYEGTQYLYDKYNTKLILVTLGPKGCFFRKGENTGHSRTYKVKTIDTTGAGDAFLGGMLYQVIKNGLDIEKYTAEELHRCLEFANATGALATVEKGAIPAMPSLEEVERCIREIEKL